MVNMILKSMGLTVWLLFIRGGGGGGS
jgi:hypothetical protein